MKLLGLLRHAKSDWSDIGAEDIDRTLNDRGRKGAALMGEHIRDHGVRWDRILASPAKRVVETLAASGLDIPITQNEDIYMASAEQMIDILRKVEGDPTAVIMAGHNPGLQELVFALADDEDERLLDRAAEKFPTASFAVLELDIDNWSDLTRHCGRFVHFSRPRDLDIALGPELKFD